MNDRTRSSAGRSGVTTAAPRSANHRVRIIGGQWKRTPLPVAASASLRPTPARVRETLFNWLGQDLSGWRCVDAFAGTGALGFEAASRGAAEVRLIEQDRALVQRLEAVRRKLGADAVLIECGDGVAALARLAPGSVDLVFLDPPFDAGCFDAALRAAAQAIRPGGRIYLEAPTAWGDEALAPFGLRLSRHLHAGMVHAHLLERASEV
ncbi:MAG: 16S rRNA (guanine(966)-N(2))-methyltransferase [Burkholderiaceae bacterium]|jgi:16S rRNA (guanine(966)-N(2))-methyltransferase RsmD|nr:MAG: 16S rRNA (guanine(966)-N(2))-methyltransferase [Burkholderiaceae bacterium]